MSLTSWEKGRGDRQLRVVGPQGFEQTETAAFVLGSDLPGFFEDLEPGDYIEVERSVDLTTYNYVRARCAFRGPVAGPSTAWLFSITVDGVSVAQIEIEAEKERESFADLAAHVSKLTGVHDVGFKLELEP